MTYRLYPVDHDTNLTVPSLQRYNRLRLLLGRIAARLLGSSIISDKIAKVVSSTLAILLIGLGLSQLLPSSQSSLLATALVVAGTAILFGRSWGYYIVYLITFGSLLPPQRTSFVPFAGTIRQAARLYAGLEPEVTYVLSNLLIAGLLAWMHYTLYQSRRLDQPLSTPARYRVVLAGLLVSIAAILLPFMFFIYALIIDPPGPGGPGVPGGGMIAAYVVFLSWPFVLAGIVGVVVFGRMLRRHR